MTDDDIRALLNSVGVQQDGKRYSTDIMVFARAVAAAARREAMEEAAKLVDDLVLDHPGRADLTAIQCAAAIRARAEEPL